MDWCHYENPEQEKKDYEELIRQDPENAHAYFKLATVHAFLLDYEQAISCCKKAVEYGWDPAYYEFLAFIYQKQWNYDSAIYWFEMLNMMDPRDVYYICELATMYDLIGDREGVRIQFERLKKLREFSVAVTLKRLLSKK